MHARRHQSFDLPKTRKPHLDKEVMLRSVCDRLPFQWRKAARWVRHRVACRWSQGFGDAAIDAGSWIGLVLRARGQPDWWGALAETWAS